MFHGNRGLRKKIGDGGNEQKGETALVYAPPLLVGQIQKLHPGGRLYCSVQFVKVVLHHRSHNGSLVALLHPGADLLQAASPGHGQDFPPRQQN